MQMDELTASLEERGFLWQAFGFGLIGVITLGVLSVYSDSTQWIIDTYRMAVTQLQWAFIAPIVAIIEGVRNVFETKTRIREKAVENAVSKAEARGEKRGEREAAERIRANLQGEGIELTPEQEKAIFGSNGHKRWQFWRRD